MRLMKYAILSMILPFVAEAACCKARSSSGCRTTPGCRKTTSTCQRASAKRGGCCRQYWDVHPRPEFNPPDDIATLPEREQERFVKMFRLVPDQVKVKSTQNYAGRMMFVRSTQYAAITNKLAAKLVRSAKMLASDPAVTPEEVQKMCFDTIVYGRSLIMGRMEQCTLADLAGQYRFKTARKIVETIEDSKNFRRGLTAGYPHQDPECRDFETLAKAANPAQWRTFLDRVESLLAKNGMAASACQVTKKQLYDRYDDPSGRPLPDDLETLPNRERLRLSKAYNLLPAQVLAVAGQDYARRQAYLTSPSYAELKKNLATRLARNTRMLAADPAVTSADVLKMCDETVRFGRPLAFGDMRHVALSDLASRYGFKEVEKFVLEVEDGKTSKKGYFAGYPDGRPEFKDYAILAQKAYPDRWNAFRTRLDTLNSAFARKIASRR